MSICDSISLGSTIAWPVWMLRALLFQNKKGAVCKSVCIRWKFVAWVNRYFIFPQRKHSTIIFSSFLTLGQVLKFLHDYSQCEKQFCSILSVWKCNEYLPWFGNGVFELISTEVSVQPIGDWSYIIDVACNTTHGKNISRTFLFQLILFYSVSPNECKQKPWKERELFSSTLNN